MDKCTVNAQKLAIIANTIAVALTENLTASEQNVLGNLIVQIGSTMLSIAAATEFCNNAKSNTSKSQDKSSDNSAQNSQTASSGNTTQNAKPESPVNSNEKAKS